MDKDEWEKQATNIIKVEMAKQDLSYEDLRQALSTINVEKTTPNLVKTINLGKFSFSFFLQVMTAIHLQLELKTKPTA